MKVVLPGGSGHLGTLLSNAFLAAGHEVVVLTRKECCERHGRTWDGRRIGDELEGADAVINLAGRSVDCRYTPPNREEILRSRVDSTRAVGEAIARAARPPRVWLQASTATIYSHRYDAANDERYGIIGGSEPDAPPEWRFSIEVAQAWERAVDEAETPRTRKVKMRTAMVMSARRGGPFHALLRHVRLGFGRLGDGRQWMSWIHERDFVRAVEWLLAHDEAEGVVNLASPRPLPNDEFLDILRKAWRARLHIPVTRTMLGLGAWAMRTEPELVLKSRRVVPQRLLDSGFTFDFPRWQDAARDLCAAWRSGAASRGATW
ncbi:MAG TPA: TIGR01777 family oxidoreductase [Thermoanaerobaculia bacterium]|jgi:hypothetical protein